MESNPEPVTHKATAMPIELRWRLLASVLASAAVLSNRLSAHQYRSNPDLIAVSPAVTSSL